MYSKNIQSLGGVLSAKYQTSLFVNRVYTIQIFCSPMSINVRSKFLKLPTTVGFFNSQAMRRASARYAFVRRIHLNEANEC